MIREINYFNLNYVCAYIIILPIVSFKPLSKENNHYVFLHFLKNYQIMNYKTNEKREKFISKMEMFKYSGKTKMEEVILHFK